MSDEHHPPPTFDALMPPEIAAKATDVGAAKAGMPTLTIFALAVLAGAFIALGAPLLDDRGRGRRRRDPLRRRQAPRRTGLLPRADPGRRRRRRAVHRQQPDRRWPGPSRKVSTGRLLRNWTIVYVGNLVGALATVGLVFLSGQYEFGDGAIGSAALADRRHEVVARLRPALSCSGSCATRSSAWRSG